MSVSIVRGLLLPLYTVIALVTLGFIGILVFDGLTDAGSVDAATTRYVYPNGHLSGNYSFIQNAIDSSSDGDIIRVFAGTYDENNLLINKKITLIGNSSKNTTIDGGGVGDVIKITVDGVHLSGFKIINSGSTTAGDWDAGIDLDDVYNVTINNNNCSNNNVGIYVRNGGSNRIINNTCYLSTNDGIFLYYSNSNNIVNNTCIYNGADGIILFGSDSSIVENNSCRANVYYGIWIERSDLNKIRNNTCVASAQFGIYLIYSDQNTIAQNICNYNGYFGIYAALSYANHIENNECSYNNYSVSALNCGGIRCEFSNSNLIANNSCVNPNGEGISLGACESSIILNNSLVLCSLYVFGFELKYWNTHTIDIFNTVNGDPVRYYKDLTTNQNVPTTSGQVILANCSNFIIEDLNIDGGAVALELGYSNSNLIANNTLSNARFGIYLFSSMDNTLENNICNSNLFYGTWLSSSEENVIKQNICNSNGIHGLGLYSSNNNTFLKNNYSANDMNGVYLSNSIGNEFANNSFSSNDIYGIFLNSSNSNTFINNKISENNDYGMNILDASNNIFYYNNFILNTNQIKSGGISTNNQFDNGHYEGNYWSDYSGLDDGSGTGKHEIAGDGIGDTMLPHLGFDHYPFMNRSGWFAPGIPILLDPGEYNSDGSYTISWNLNRGTSRYLLQEDDTYDFTSPVSVYNGSELSYQAKFMPNNTYYYRLKAFNEFHESPWSNIVDITVDWKPNKPLNLKVSAYPGGNALNLTWELNLNDTEVYELYYKNESMTSWALQTIIHPIHTFNHTDLVDGCEYTYKLRARDARDQLSVFTENVSAIPADTMAPQAPTGLTVVEISFDWIKLSWVPNTESDVKGYNIFQENRSKLIDPWDLIGKTQVGEEVFIVTNLEENTEYRFVITAFDEVPNNSSYSIWVYETTTLGPHAPEINDTYVVLQKIKDFKMAEDSQDNSINLLNWFTDDNFDTLQFWHTYSGDEHINVSIHQENGTVVLKPQKNWNGKMEIIFYATDGDFNIFDTLIINVTYVNDAPGPAAIKSPSDGLEIKEDEPVVLKGECFDPDLPYGDDLTFEWSSSISNKLGEGENLTLELKPGKHRITLKVSDSFGEAAYATVNLTVTEDESEISNLLIASISGIIIVILLIIILAVLLKKRKKAEEKEEVVLQPEVEFPSSMPVGFQRPYEKPAALSEPPPATPSTSPEHATPIPSTEIQPMIPGAEGPGYVPGVEGASTPEQELMVPSEISAGMFGMPRIETPMLPPTGIESVPTQVELPIQEWGKVYILITKGQEFGISIFENLLGDSPNRGLFITRTHPSQLKTGPIMDFVTKIWLSKTPEHGSVSPGNITKITHIISEFLKANANSVIMLDGLEYLINNNDFPRVLKFLELLHEVIVLNDGVLLVPVNPSTMSKTNFELLQNELTNTIRDPEYPIESMIV